LRDVFIQTSGILYMNQFENLIVINLFKIFTK
jgi:hypothetical protein